MLSVPTNILTKELESLKEYQNITPMYIDNYNYKINIIKNNQLSQDNKDILIIDSVLDSNINSNFNSKQLNNKNDNTDFNEKTQENVNPTYLRQNMIKQDLIKSVINHIDLAQSTFVALESLRIIHVINI